ncbi:hypothetical protein [Brucella sp. 191011898]|uniref:hypothetical protein n=1 Tax=Brucella sp. 191011898 TaxID=2730447 RepID=UPI0015DF902D|nr:hypothetical protein [Brucella sp. 191011898]CAB4324925.1 hypothetical protein BCH_00139 [Brucella sp. 191011898]
MQIEHESNGSEKSKLRAIRVHRVLHRIGVVLGLPILLVGFCLLLVSGYMSVTGFTPAKVVSDVIDYSYPVTQKGDTVVYRDGSTQSVSSYIAQENGVRASRHQVSINDTFAFGLLFSFGSIAIYGIFRAIGWIIAGAF